MKSEVSSRFSQLRKARAATGNMEVETPTLTEMDQKILGIIGLEYIEGSSVCVDAFPEEYVMLNHKLLLGTFNTQT